MSFSDLQSFLAHLERQGDLRCVGRGGGPSAGDRGDRHPRGGRGWASPPLPAGQGLALSPGYQHPRQHAAHRSGPGDAPGKAGRDAGEHHRAAESSIAEGRAVVATTAVAAVGGAKETGPPRHLPGGGGGDAEPGAASHHPVLARRWRALHHSTAGGHPGPPDPPHQPGSLPPPRLRWTAHGHALAAPEGRRLPLPSSREAGPAPGGGCRSGRRPSSDPRCRSTSARRAG